MTCRIAWSIGEKLLKILSFDKTMTLSTLVRRLKHGSKTIILSSWYGQPISRPQSNITPMASLEEEAGNFHQVEIQLWEQVEKEWEGIDTYICQGLIHRISRRVEAVLQAKGGYKKY